MKHLPSWETRALAYAGIITISLGLILAGILYDARVNINRDSIAFTFSDHPRFYSITISARSIVFYHAE